MNNIKKINFNDSKKSTSKKSIKKDIISHNNNKKSNKISEIIFLEKKRNINSKHIIVFKVIITYFLTPYFFKYLKFI